MKTPIEITINTRDEHGVKQPLDRKTAEALGSAGQLLFDHFSEMQNHPVYVDTLMNHGWRLGQSCHCFVDVDIPLEVLHGFAAKIGMKRKWFQFEAGRLPHYDLTKSRRELAVKLGAIELDRAAAVAIFRKWKGR